MFLLSVFVSVTSITFCGEKNWRFKKNSARAHTVMWTGWYEAHACEGHIGAWHMCFDYQLHSWNQGSGFHTPPASHPKCGSNNASVKTQQMSAWWRCRIISNTLFNGYKRGKEAGVMSSRDRHISTNQHLSAEWGDSGNSIWDGELVDRAKAVNEHEHSLPVGNFCLNSVEGVTWCRVGSWPWIMLLITRPWNRYSSRLQSSDPEYTRLDQAPPQIWGYSFSVTCWTAQDLLFRQ